MVKTRNVKTLHKGSGLTDTFQYLEVIVAGLLSTLLEIDLSDDWSLSFHRQLGLGYVFCKQTAVASNQDAQLLSRQV